MAHNLCCDSYHVYNVTYIYNTIVPILGVKYVTCDSVLIPGTVVHRLGSWLLCTLWFYWFPAF